MFDNTNYIVIKSSTLHPPHGQIHLKLCTLLNHRLRCLWQGLPRNQQRRQEVIRGQSHPHCQIPLEQEARVVHCQLDQHSKQHRSQPTHHPLL
jgi:hypothetical protein